MSQDAAVTLPLGERYLEQRANVARFFSDEGGRHHVADLGMVDFLDGLAHRKIVFVSEGLALAIAAASTGNAPSAARASATGRRG